MNAHFQKSITGVLQDFWRCGKSQKELGTKQTASLWNWSLVSKWQRQWNAEHKVTFANPSTSCNKPQPLKSFNSIARLSNNFPDKILIGCPIRRSFFTLSHRLVKALMWHALREIIKQTNHYYKRQLATAALFKRRYNKMEPSRQMHLKSEVGSAGSLKSSFVSDTGLFVIKSSSIYKALLTETMRLIHTRICIGCWIII